MIFQTVTLDSAGPNVTLTLYLADVSHPLRDAILVIPGGGYGCVCSDREGEPIALAFLARGMNAFVLNYTVKPANPYQPLMDASLAMSWIKENADTCFVDPERVFVVGFSAGGHLAASLGTMWHDETLNRQIRIKPESNRPAGMILCYPVIGVEGHPDSFQNLLGAAFGDETLMHSFSVHERVSDKTCPAFLIHTASDKTVPVRNSLMMADALHANHIPFEMHIYPEGPHGMALANSDTNMGRAELTDAAYARWVDDAVIWMNRLRG